MNLFMNLPALLAQLSRTQGLGGNFRGPGARVDGGDMLMIAMLVLGAVGVIVLLSVLLRLQERRNRCNNPQKLFRDICRLHELDRKSRKLLTQLARHQDLEHPARLFLEPARFNPENVGAELGQHQREFDTLRGRLFSVS